MKTLLFIFVLAPFIGISQSTTTPVEYNDKLVDFQNAIGYKMVAMNEEIGRDEATKESVNAKRLEILKVANESIKGAEKMPPYEGNTELRNTGLDLFRFYKRVIENEYLTLINLLYQDELTDEAIEEMNAIIAKISEEEAEYDFNFEMAQTNFAEKYDIELIENELQDEIDEE